MIEAGAQGLVYEDLLTDKELSVQEQHPPPVDEWLLLLPFLTVRPWPCPHDLHPTTSVHNRCNRSETGKE